MMTTPAAAKWCGSIDSGKNERVTLVRHPDVTMKSPVIKRSILIAGHKTSVSLEDAFWKALKEIAQARRQSVPELIASIDDTRQMGSYTGNLSSAIRVFVLDYYRQAER
jgi:predicted DNA-binding ribbon-helix-helix protein